MSSNFMAIMYSTERQQYQQADFIVHNRTMRWVLALSDGAESATDCKEVARAEQ